MRSFHPVALLIGLATSWSSAWADDGNRLTYLDESDSYYVSRHFPKLTTPQWIGEEGVEAVVVLAIDDMRDPRIYENFLRPVLRRLRQIDGRAPVSIMTNQVNPNDPLLPKWLQEGLSLETHTFDHPMPLLKDGDLAKAKANYDRCVDLLDAVPGNRATAFRMPFCDSLDSVSPRFFAEIFNRTTPRGNWLTIDSSVFNLLTSDDPELPRELVIDADGQDKFRKYVPPDRSFVNTIEDYPYPYVIGRLCWEFPCVVPSDWEANHRHQANNPLTVRDWKAALDAIVRKQGVFNLVFHPHGWIRADQLVDFIDYAVARHGKKVKFLTFREAQERLDKFLLAGHPLRNEKGADNGVRLIDLDGDGFLDVVIGNEKTRQTRRWSPTTRSWVEGDFPVSLAEGIRFGVVHPNGRASLLYRNEKGAGAWHFDGGKWVEHKDLLHGLEVNGQPIETTRKGRDRGVRFRDLDRDGRCELIVSNPEQQAIFSWSAEKKAWTKLPFVLPAEVALVNAMGQDNGLRFMDVDEDGHDDLLFANEEAFGLYLFTSMRDGWSRQVRAGKRGASAQIPLIARAGTNNGAWFHSRHLWVQNEDTALLKDHVARRSFNELLEGVVPQAKTATASLAAIRPRPGFVVELMAAEPLVQDPIAFNWGPDGKLWVVEMGDYPLGVDGQGKPGGRVKYLESTKGDGRYDKATLFLDGLPFPTGVLPWGKGVLVTCAPEIFYAEDTDGDGRADLRRTLYTGFVEGNQQHRLNGLVWGLDNWVYGANGDSGGVIKSIKTGAIVNISGRDFRIRPDEGLLDAQTGQTQYGRCRDDWGNWFGCNNSNPMYHFVLADHYLRRNPHLSPPDPRVPVSVAPGAAPVYPISRTLPRFNDLWAANHFTSACSVIVYRDDLFGPAFANNAFVSEPVHNLIHREIMAPRGVTFTSQRAPDEQHAEFLASSDNWFRPTMIQTGPDGALWVADMYRQVIEHPEWIPKEWQKRLDLRAGHDKGRIYRVYPVGKPPRPMPRLDRLDTAGLVAALDSPSGWQRDMAQQLLIRQADRAALPLLQNMAHQAKRPLARLHALCTLDGLAALQQDVLRLALADPHPEVRRHAVRLCEPLLAQSPRLLPHLVRLIADEDPQVRLQLAYTLGVIADPRVRAGDILGHLALADKDDPYLAAAVMSSVNKQNLEALLLTVLAASKESAPPASLLGQLLQMANALGNAEALTKLLATLAAPERGRFASWQYTILASLLDALDQRSTSLLQLRQSGPKDLTTVLDRLAPLFDEARATVADQQADRARRLAAVPLLGRGLNDRQRDIDRLAMLLVPQTGDDLQVAAVASLGRLRESRVPEVLLRGWKGYGPGLRSQVLDVLLRRGDWLKAALDAIERRQVEPFEVDAPRRQRLLEHKKADVRARAARLFTGTANPDRQKVIDSYQGVLTQTGDARRGLQVFTRTCAACHRLGQVGNAVGPDLASVGDKSPQGLLTAILDPNRAVEARYVNYYAVTKNGLTYSGVLAQETGNNITLIGVDGKQAVILRTDLEELVSTGKSAMPEGLEKDLQPQDIADVIAFVRSNVPLPKRKEFAGNNPELVRPAADGSLRLLASNGEIYGSTLVLETTYGNLGYWSSQDDHAIWSIDVARPGPYAVWLEWACDNGTAGNGFVLEAGTARLEGKVGGTGTWDDYKQARTGTITLKAGRHQVVLRSAGKVTGAMIDLKAIKLVPITAAESRR